MKIRENIKNISLELTQENEVSQKSLDLTCKYEEKNYNRCNLCTTGKGNTK